jgi:hypothetical protein
MYQSREIIETTHSEGDLFTTENKLPSLAAYSPRWGESQGGPRLLLSRHLRGLCVKMIYRDVRVLRTRTILPILANAPRAEIALPKA